ncbi:MAG: GNAT family N-acetyltransferase, partial [Bacteroidia bacterium]|nr:GNAT family N-acetyltransferase [Bacteroidia bacterium]
MCTIKIITHTDSLLNEVIALGKKNSKTLGMFPEGAFIDHAKKRNIIVAQSENQLVGYLLYRITQSKGIISITHLCIVENYRNQGIAKKLVNFLKEKYQNLFRGIALSCRKDYTEASTFYEKSGFKAVKESRSRSKEENYLVKWFYNFGNADLFTEMKLYSNKLNVLLDANIIIKLRDEINQQNAEAHALNADWLSEEVEFFFASEIYNEINRDRDRNRAQLTRDFLKNFQETKFNPEKRDAIFTKLTNYLPGKSQNDISDKRQLAECIASGLSYFITTDDEILSVGENIFKEFSLRIFRPTELILHIDQLRNKTDYFSSRVAGANYQYRKLGQDDIKTLSEEFTDSTNSKFELISILTLTASDVKNSIVRLVQDGENKTIGFFAAIYKDGYLRVRALKTQKNRLSDVLFYQLVNDIIQLSVSKNVKIINIEELSLTEVMVETLTSYGFQEKDGLWYKLVIAGMFDSLTLLNKNELLKNNWNIPLILKKFKTLNKNESEIYKLELERKLWPIKLTDINIPTYIIPIKPLWASHLFDTVQAGHDLFGANPESSWNRENIYFRNVRPVSEKVPARILWYISSQEKNPIGRQKGIIGCSYLDEVYTGS